MYKTFSDLFDYIDEFKIVSKYVDTRKTKHDKQIDNILSLVYVNIMKFKQDDLVKGGVFSTNFLENVCCLILG